LDNNWTYPPFAALGVVQLRMEAHIMRSGNPHPRTVVTLGVGVVCAASAALPVLAEVEIPPGFEVVQITDDDHEDTRPRMNNCGQIVFSKVIEPGADNEEIFLYDNGQLIRLTDNDVRDTSPDINDHGTIVWSQAKVPGAEGLDLEIVMYQNGEVIQVTNDQYADIGPRVNSLDHIVWYQRSGPGCPPDPNDGVIFFYDGVEIQDIARDEFTNQAAAINDFDDIAWTRYNFCVTPWEGTIMVRISGETTELGNPEDQNQSVDINNLGQVVWANNTRAVFLWQNGSTELLTESGRVPDLNNEGDLAFSRWDDDAETWDQWAIIQDDIFQLTDEPITNGNGVINDYREMAWRRGAASEQELIRLRPVLGNCNGDGAVDVLDFEPFGDCMTGPLRSSGLWCQGTADLEGDGDVDLYDFVLLQLTAPDPSALEGFIPCMTGPLPSRDPCFCRLLDLDHDSDVDLGDFLLFQELVDSTP
jgi:hypothetical protein